MSSRPPTPSPEEPVDGYVGCRFHENATACEWGESYRPGGYHPVRLGDTFYDRFHVIRKIGYGSFSTVWLAHDDLIVHGDLHAGNILVSIRPQDCEAGTIGKLRQNPDDGEPLRRLDGKIDLWAPTYLLPPAGLLAYVSTELDPFVKLVDLGGSFRFDEIPTKITTPRALRAPETILKLPVGPSIDIWSFGCLAFELITGHDLIGRPSLLMGDGPETIDDEHRIKLSEIIGPLPELLFDAWRRGPAYFGPDGKRVIVAEEKDVDDESMGYESDTESPVDLSDLEDTEFDEDPVSPEMDSSEDPLSYTRLSEALENMFRRWKPEGTSDTEERDILHLLRWVLQLEAKDRPTVEGILGHKWFQT
ncbi:hypothetical protein N8I77_006410 [Diaporthe amygdali]|uniref:non-specific serine/threonine protein kinase n=1 Tax=Phomopsis amygdali TaxID=1214568 RepID=A0AAD9SHQ7_PHOAM|nr:hypothetical protein N8I77_006410 [Diaporthe amygdali]